MNGFPDSIASLISATVAGESRNWNARGIFSSGL
jgi:hypothetical protein